MKISKVSKIISISCEFSNNRHLTWRLTALRLTFNWGLLTLIIFRKIWNNSQLSTKLYWSNSRNIWIFPAIRERVINFWISLPTKLVIILKSINKVSIFLLQLFHIEWNESIDVDRCMKRLFCVIKMTWKISRNKKTAEVSWPQPLELFSRSGDFRTSALPWQNLRKIWKFYRLLPDYLSTAGIFFAFLNEFLELWKTIEISS